MQLNAQFIQLIIIHNRAKPSQSRSISMSNPFLRKNTTPNGGRSILDRALSHNPSPDPNPLQSLSPTNPHPTLHTQNTWTNQTHIPPNMPNPANNNILNPPSNSVFEIRQSQNKSNPENIPKPPKTTPKNSQIIATSPLNLPVPSLVVPPPAHTSTDQPEPPRNNIALEVIKAKILYKIDGELIGQFTFSQSMIFNANSISKPTEINISQAYCHKVFQNWKNTIKCNDLLSLNLNSNWQSVLVDCQRKDLSQVLLKPGLIFRLREGFRFYDHNGSRGQFIRKFIEQNKETNSYKSMSDSVEKIHRLNQMDIFLCYYFVRSISNFEQQNPKGFIHQDKLNLVKIYSLLWKHKQQRLFAQIFRNQPQNYLKQAIKHYLNNYVKQSQANNTELGIQLINLLTQIITIKNQTDFTNIHQMQFIAHLTKQMNKMVQQNNTLGQKMNILLIELYCRSDGRIQMGLSEEVEAFLDYYVKNVNQIQQNPQKLKRTMAKLHLYRSYGKQTAPKVVYKIQRYIERNKGQQQNIKPGELIIAMETVLLLKQVTKLQNKENSNQYLDELLGILYQHSPLFVLNYKSNDRPLNQLILPLICRHSQTQGSSGWVGIWQLNNSIPKEYQFPSGPTNYLLVQHLLQILDLQAHQSAISNRQSLEDIQETLAKFDVRSSQRSTGESQSNQQLMITKYIVKYTEAFAKQYTYVIPKKNSTLVEAPKDQHFINLLLERLLQSIQNFIKINEIYEKQANASHFFNFQKMLVNIQALSQCLSQSGLIPMSSSYQAFYYKNRPEYLYMIKIDVKTIYKKIVNHMISLVSKFNYQPICLVQTLRSIYSDWQKKVEQGFQNFMVYLFTVQALRNFNLSDDAMSEEIEKIDKLKKGINIGAILKEIIKQSIERKQTNNNGPPSQFTKLGLSVFSLYLLCNAESNNGKENKPQSFNCNINRGLVISHAQSIIQLTIATILQTANDASGALFIQGYCQLIRLVLNLTCKNQQGEPPQVLKQAAKIYKSSHPIRLFACCFDPKSEVIQTEEQLKLLKMIDVVFVSANKSDAPQQVQLADIAVAHDEKLLQIIVQKEYLPKACSSLLAVMDRLIQDKDRNSLTSIKQAIRGMNIYSKLFLKNIGVVVDQLVVSKFVRSIRLIFSHRKQLLDARQLPVWVYLTIGSIGNKLGSAQQFQMFMCEVIEIIAQHANTLRQCSNVVETCIRVTQFMMIYTKQIEPIFKTRKDKSHIIHVIKIIRLILQVFANPSSNESQLFCYDHQLQRWLKCAVVITLKVCQFINMKAATDRSLGDINDEARETIQAINILIQRNSTLDRLQERVQRQLKDFLMSSAQLLTLGKSNNKTNYRNYNQALINVAMMNKESYRGCLVGLAREILKPASSRHKINDVTEDKYRLYYLFYYFLKKHIEDQHGKYVRFMFNEESNGQEKCQVDQTIFTTLSELVYFLSENIEKGQSKTDVAWKTIILQRLLRTRIQLLRLNKFTLKILQFCLRNLQQRTNQQQSLDEWLVYNQTIGIVYLIFKTHSHCDQINSGDSLILDVLRARIYKEIEGYILKSNRLRDDQSLKMTELSMEPIQIITQKNENRREDYRTYKSIKHNLKDFKFVSIADKIQNKNMEAENTEDRIKNDEVSVWDYLKITMVLSSTSLFLNYYRLDTLMASAIDSLFWSKLIQFCQQVLKQYGKINDRYFADKKVKSQAVVDKIEHNRRMISQGLFYYIKDIDLTNSQHYLNKIMSQHCLHQLSFKKTINNVHDISQNMESAYKWCYDIQQSLTVFGVKGDKRFYLESNKPLSLKMSGKSRRF